MKRALLVAAQHEGLSAPERDAARLRDALVARDFTVDLRRGADASRAGILEGLAALIAATAPGDAALFHYGGHGGRFVNPDPRAGDPDHPAVPLDAQYLVPTDYRESTDDDFRGISAWELRAQLAALRTDDVTALFDCCHAAELVRDPTAAGAVARTLPYLRSAGVERYLAALAARGIDIAGPPRGNPALVAGFACGEHENAYEVPRVGGAVGAFTDALVWLLDQLGDAPVAWEVAAGALVRRVRALAPGQRPVFGGPVTRVVLGRAHVPRQRVVAIELTYERPILALGSVAGTAVGDTFAVAPLGAPAEASVAIATVTRVRPLTADLALDPPLAARALPEAAVAWPRTRAIARVPIRVDGHGAAAELLRAELARSPRLALGDDDALARVVVYGTAAVVSDRLGPLHAPFALDDATARAALLALLARIAAADAVLALATTPGFPAEAAHITWGEVTAAGPGPARSDGAVLAPGAQLYLRVENRSARAVHVHVFDVAPDATIARVTRQDLGGRPLAPGQVFTLPPAEDLCRAGIGVAWPTAVPPVAARREELVVLATGEPVDLGVLETTAASERDALPAGATPLQHLAALLHRGGERAVLADDAFAVARTGFWLDPR